jgi:plastocyanin
LTACFVGLVLVTIAGCSHGGPGPASPPASDAGSDDEGGSMPTVLVGPNGMHAFLPPSLTVPVGTTVQWFWESDGHNVTSGGAGVADGKFCSPDDTTCDSPPTTNAGAIYRHTFTERGTFPYFCVPHYAVGMKGTVTVQ